jgi:hypothetical protein
VSIARPRKISQIKPLFGNLAQTSHYQVYFGGLSRPLQSYLTLRGVSSRFVAESAGLLCSSASLPGSSLGTADIVGDVTGVAEKMAHTRIFTAIDLTFYVDNEYRMLKFLEHWIEFIASGSGVNAGRDGYFFRMKYPIDYKTNTTKILKFDRDYRNEIEYNFFGLFPTAIYSPSIAYSDSQVLTVTASFSYERYVCGSITSVDINSAKDNNKQPQNTTQANTSGNSQDRLATGRDEMLWRNRNEGTGRLDDPRPRGIADPTARNSGWFSFGDGGGGSSAQESGIAGTSGNSGTISANNESIYN